MRYRYDPSSVGDSGGEMDLVARKLMIRDLARLDEELFVFLRMGFTTDELAIVATRKGLGLEKHVVPKCSYPQIPMSEWPTK